ncbi:MAG: RimK family alpha-L-glutamate ligase [Candidatus Bathyarchaeia archaeon]
MPIPKTILTFTPDEAVKAVKELEYPAVFKPVTGSWGRMIAPLRDEETTRALIEFREQFPGPFSQIYYLQEMVKRPPRDIRTIVVGDELVAAVYRHAPPDEWRTNVARGGITAPCPITQELQEIALKAADAVGGGVLGVDAMESPDGIVVHEVNGTIEFKGAASATGVDIPGAIIDYTVKLAKR